MWVLARETVEGRWEVKRIGKISTHHVLLSCMVDIIDDKIVSPCMNELLGICISNLSAVRCTGRNVFMLILLVRNWLDLND